MNTKMDDSRIGSHIAVMKVIHPSGAGDHG
jgi:hypothetical protein